MSSLVVFIEDKIRDEDVRLKVNVNSPIDAVIEGYVDQYGLPRRYFDLSRIEYRLVRAVDGRHLSGQMTFREANIAQGELLRLTSPEGRRVWQAVQRLLDEIESQIKDQITGKIKDRIVEEVWDRVTDKLAWIEKTHTGGHRVEQVREWVNQIGGPTKLVEIGEKIYEVTEPRPTSLVRSIGAAVVKATATAVTIGGGIAISLVGAALVSDLILASGDVQPTPMPTERITATAPTTEPPTPQPPVQDTDGDGLNDNYEMEIGTDPNNPDTDQDGLSDGGEVQGCTNPLDPDTDGDGLGDGDEVNRGSDPCNPNDPPRDDDGDGLTNEQEHRLGTDPRNPDSDYDGLPDGQEVQGCTDPLVPDTDGDGLGDGDEVNQGTDPCDPNDPPRDDDRDGLTNEQEHRLGTDPRNPDSDYDGLPDGHEAGSCTNPLDPDTDGDGLGDGDEVNRGSDPCDPNDPPRDDDRDGLTNEQEYQLGTNPNDPDSDDDGLPDGREAGSCTDPLDPDTDGDELGDGDEVNRGSDPCDPNDPYAPMPDLIVEIISIDKDEIVWRAEPWTWIHYRVSNIGEATAEGAVYLRDWTNGSPTSGYMLVEGPIAPGGSVESRFAVGHDNVWPPGDYAVQMEVDYQSLINEANEDNNFSGIIHFRVVAAGPELQDFIGNWYNVDRNTRGTTRIDIWQKGDSTFVHGYGSCSPTDCDWGTVAASLSGSSLVADYVFSFKTSHLEMTLEGDRLQVYSTHRFTDGTDRDYDSTEYFYRQTVQ